MSRSLFGLCTATALLSLSTAGLADQVISDDLIVERSLCVGNDCASGESFGFDAIRLKENNLRIHFDDTSTSASFPNRDWRILINDTANGGDNFFGINDPAGARTPFRIDAGAPADSLRITGSGRIGVGTGSPAITGVHIRSGNSPALRLDQDGSSGFAPQIFDISANETSFFIRDTTNGSQLPFRIFPGADDSSLTIDSDNDIGMGIQRAAAALHVRRSENARVFVENTTTTTGARTMLELKNAGRPEIILANTANNAEWSFGAGSNFILKQGAVGSVTGDKTKLFEIDDKGNAFLAGELVTGGSECGGGCDRVFTEEQVIPAAEYHAAMWDQGYLPHVGPTVENAPINVSAKLGGMLNALEHAHVFIEAQADEIAALKARIEALEHAN